MRPLITDLSGVAVLPSDAFRGSEVPSPESDCSLCARIVRVLMEPFAVGRSGKNQ